MPEPGPHTIPTTPAVVRWARAEVGLTTREAAEKLRVPLAELEAIEDGRHEPSPAVFQRMKTLYQRSESVLLLPEPPPEYPSIPNFRGLTRNKIPRGETALAIREARRLQLFLSELLAEDPELLPRFRVRPPAPGAEPEEVAADERARLGISVGRQLAWPGRREAFQAWRAAVQNAGVLVIQQKMEWRDCRGIALQGPSLVPTIVVNTRDSFTGRIFTLFHEYGHLVNGSSASCLGGPASEQFAVEAWCDRFSAAFLMPSVGMQTELQREIEMLGKGDWTLSRVQRAAGRFRVSPFAMARRLFDLGISNYYVRHKQELFEAQRHRARVDGGGGGERAEHTAVRLLGTGISFAVLDAMHRGVLDRSEAAEALRIPFGRLSALEELATEQRHREIAL